jgi:hypothetical protein
VLGCAGVLLAGCGYSRTPAPPVGRPATPTGFVGEGFPTAKIALYFPRNWTVTQSQLPLAATISSGPAVVAVWRYPRTVPPPPDRAALKLARAALISAARARGRSLTLIRTSLTRISGAPTIVLDAFERIAGGLRRVRSLHMFVPGAEIVLDEYAPPSEFHAIDHLVFSPLNHSINLRRSERA